MSGASIGGRCTTGDYATVGTNATILPDIKIGEVIHWCWLSCYKKRGKNSVIARLPGKYIRKNENNVDQEIFKKF